MPGVQVALAQDAVTTVESLVIWLLRAAQAFGSPPNILAETPASSFMGGVFFRENWALVVLPDPARQPA